ncbi:MAG: PD-(D/E)XK nuclease family protein [Planctomycetota bacterium]|nr:PD-(D/E)XK nuclease family protein [Planctomycetota bacterium]
MPGTLILPPHHSLMRALGEAILAATVAPAGSAFIDLTDTVVIVPARRAQESLCRHLQDLALEQNGKPVLLPTVLTPGRSLQHFIVPDKTAAQDEAVVLACFHAVRSEAKRSHDSLRALLGHEATRAETLTLAQRLAALLSELSRVGLRPSDVLTRGKHAELGEFFPDDLWMTLEALDRAARARLDDLGLDLPHAIAARAIASGRLATAGVKRVFVLLADPIPLERQLLAALECFGVQVHIALHADDLPHVDGGFPNHEGWSSMRPPVDQDSIVTVGGADEQAAVVLEALSRIEGGDTPLNPDSLAVAALRPADAELLARQLAHTGITVATPPSRTADQGAAALLLGALAEWCGEPTALTLGTLIRHPWVESWLYSQGVRHALRDVTGFVATTGVRRLDAPLVSIAPRDGAIDPTLSQVRKLCAPLIDATDAGSPHDTLAAMHHLLLTLAPTTSTPADATASTAVANALLALAEQPTALLDGCGLEELFQLLSSMVSPTDLPSERPDGIECMGWLEAGVCDAPHVVVLSANDGVLPAPTPIDPWLPDSLRQTLGLPCARARRARDAWLLDGILKRKASVTFGVPATSAEGEPVLPSRFLLGDNPLQQAERLLSLSNPATRARLGDWPVTQPPGPGFTACPMPEALPEVGSISVTGFRTYLECPYRFFLQRVLWLGREDDMGLELDPMQFGTLVHEALHRWGVTEAARAAPSLDTSAIALDLVSALDDVVLASIPASIHGAATVQIQMARARLQAFAPVQSAWAAKGWRVRHVELDFSARAVTAEAPTLEHPHGVMFPDADGLLLTGRIDRVDFNEQTGQWAAIDYKTSGDAATPDGHQSGRTNNKNWIDLQLPLYRELLASTGLAREHITLAIAALPADGDRSVMTPATWDAAALDEAVALGADVVHRIKAGDFAPTATSLSEGDTLRPIYGIGIQGLATAPDMVPAEVAVP